MDMYKLKFTTLQNEIFRLFCIKAGISLNQREVARLLRVSPTAIAKSLKTLEEEKLIKIEKIKTMNLIALSLNRDDQKGMILKKIENLKMIYESGLVEFLEEKFPGTSIILFGSYSKGEDTIKSDLDIAIIGSKEKNIDLSEFDKKLERTINLNFYESFNMDKHLKNNILNGIILIGGIEL